MFFVLQDSTKPFFVSSSYFAWRHGRVQHLNERWSLSAFHALSSVSTVTSIRSCPGVVSIQMSAQGWKLLLLNEVHYEEMLSLEFINSLEKWQHIDEGIKMTYFKTVGHCYDFTSELRWKKNLSTFSTHTFFSHYCESREENRLCWSSEFCLLWFANVLLLEKASKFDVRPQNSRLHIMEKAELKEGFS